MKHQDSVFQRSASTTTRSISRILPSNSTHSRSFSDAPPENESEGFSENLLISKQAPISAIFSPKTHSKKLSSLIHSLLSFLSFPSVIPTCKWLSITTHLSITPSLGRKVTGTLFGYRRGHVSFAVQLDPRSEPLLVLELALSTSSLVKEMSSRLVRIALECEKDPAASGGGRKLFKEPKWTMYCNGRKCGYALSGSNGDLDHHHVLKTVQSVSVGEGVIPVVEDSRKSTGSEGELLYMRARFERVVGSRDSEAFYMMNRILIPISERKGSNLILFSTSRL